MVAAVEEYAAKAMDLEEADKDAAVAWYPKAWENIPI